jgi:ABC-2 type transport system permease protein
MSIFPFLIRKEFLQLRRDRKMLPIVLIAPVLQLILLGYAANMDVRHVPTAVLDHDKSRLSRELTESFFSTEYFDHALHLSNPAEAEDVLLTGEASAVIVIPPDFSRMLLKGRAVGLQLLVDGTNSTEGTSILNYANIIVQDYQKELLAAGYVPGNPGNPGSPSGSAGSGTTTGACNGTTTSAGNSSIGAGRARGVPSIPVEVVPRVWYNPELESKNFMVPGILALLLMVITMLLSSLAIVKEKELGTLEQLNVSPIRPRQLILGKLIPFVIIGFIDVLLVVGVSRLLFQIPFRGSFLLLLLMSMIFLATTLGLGLLISTISHNQQQAMMTAVFFVMLPMFFLSGFAFPIESMPQSIRYVTYLLPLRYYFVIIRGIFLKGAGLAVLWDQALALTLFGLAILALAAVRFRKRSS